jgi:CheY-like chemotaxis protein
VTDISPLLLYVEDDLQQRALLSEVLKQAGFRVRTAACARDGVELAARESFDAVVVDHDLPDMTGAQAAQEIRAFESSAKIVLLSGHPEVSPGELAYIDIHIVKGSLTEKLIETIYTLIGAQKLGAAEAQGHYYV